MTWEATPHCALVEGPIDQFGCVFVQDRGWLEGHEQTPDGLLWNELACVLALLGRDSDNVAPSVRVCSLPRHL